MRDIIGYKSFKVHRTQKICDEDMDLGVENSEYLIPILDYPENDSSTYFFLMNQIVARPEFFVRRYVPKRFSSYAIEDYEAL